MKVEQNNTEKSVAGIIPKLPTPMAYEYITPEACSGIARHTRRTATSFTQASSSLR